MKKQNAEQTLTRRQFFHAGLAVAGGVAAATMVTPSNTLAAWPPGETPKYKGRSHVKDAHEMYTHSEYWSEDDVVWWEGRRVGGIAIGVIQLSANIPMIPGNMGNASTFDFPLMYEPMEVTGDMVVSTKPHPEVLKRSVEAGKKLEAQGVRAICGNLRFLCQLPGGGCSRTECAIFLVKLVTNSPDFNESETGSESWSDHCGWVQTYTSPGLRKLWRNRSRKDCHCRSRKYLGNEKNLGNDRGLQSEEIRTTADRHC